MNKKSHIFYHALEETLVCPITRMIFLYPATATDGNIYEFQAIEKWLKITDISPVTGQKLPSKTLMPAHAVRNIVNNLLQYKPELKTKQYILEKKNNKDYLYEFKAVLNNKDFTKIYEYENFEIGLFIDMFYAFLLDAPLEIIKYLVDNATDFSLINDDTLIHKIAEYKNKSDVVRYFINKGIDLTKRDCNYNTLLHIVCKYQYSDLINFLIDKYVDLNIGLDIPGNDLNYPVHCILYNDYLLEADQIKLLEKFKNLEHENNNRIRVIHEACDCNTNPNNLIKYIVERGVELDCPDKYGYNPIHYLCQNPVNIPMITYFLEKNVNIECTTNSGKKPIHLLSPLTSLSIIKLFMDKGAKIEDCENIYDSESETE